MNASLPPKAWSAPGADAGVSGWLRACEAGTDLVRALDALRVLVRAGLTSAAGHAVWIHLCDDDAWKDQMALLRTRLAAECGGQSGAEGHSRAHLLARFPLLGVPFAVKDNIDIAGEPTTAACPAFKQTAQRHATVVRRLLDAGAVWVGKTNLDQFATGLVGTRSPYGQPASVFDATRVSGGSSSGSAVAVARGWVAFALGTDTAGSGRIPAGFNGLVGLKPTPGRVSTAGVLPACRTLDCVSVFAHTVADAAHVLSVLEGPDTEDAYSAFRPGPARMPAAPRIGVPMRPMFHGQAAYEPAWEMAVDRARGLGWQVVPLDFSALDEVAALLYEGPWVAERHAVVQTLLESDPEALDPTVRRVVSRAVGMTATETFQAQYRLRVLQSRLRGLWQQVDVLFVPTAPGHPTLEDLARDPVGENARLGTYTNFVNLLGWCALALPAGMTPVGLPFSITLIGPGSADVALAELGTRWESACTRVSAPSAALRGPATEASLAIAVVGAHLSGLPLNGQLTERGARLLRRTRTAGRYRLYALPGTTPPKPGMRRASDAEDGAAIEVEVWEMPQAQVGSFLALIPAPLGLGIVELEDGMRVHGFLCEAHALTGAIDITALGGWRAYLAAGAR